MDDQCLLCAAHRVGRAEADAGGTVVAYVDDDLVGLVEPGVPGVLVAPREHVEGLSRAPLEGAVVLGALRRAASAVQASYRAEGTAIEPTTDLPAAPGHVCYRIVPTRDQRPIPAGSCPDIDPDVLALALRQAPSTGTLPPG